MGAVLEHGGSEKLRSRTTNELSQNNHHLLFQQRAWESGREVKALRRHPQNIHKIYIDRHEALHEAVSHVPLLSNMMALRALSTLDALPETIDPVESIENLQKAIERAKRSKYSDTIERGIAEVAITALDMQKEFFYPEQPATVIDLYPSTQRR